MELRLRAHAGHQIVDLPWQKNAPSHWKLHRIKHLLREVDELTSSGDEPLLSLTRSRGLIRRSEVTDKPPSAKTLIGYKICRPGDIVMNRMQAWSGMFGLATELGIVSPDYAVLRLTSMTDGDFLLNLLKAPGPVSHFAALSTGMGSGFNRLYTDQLGAVPVVIPPYEEQVQIAAVIRRVDHRVNRLIRAKQRLIALLNEQKQAIIQRAVTRGLDPDVRLKPSGVEWLGEVPEHWEVRSLWTLAEPRKDRNPGGLELLSVFLDRGVIPYGEGGGQVHAPSLDLTNYQVVRPGDFVLNNQQAWRGSVGISMLHGIISPAYIVLNMSGCCHPVYMDYLLRSQVMVSQYVVASRGVGDIQRQIYWPHLRRVQVSVPPYSEQASIADHLAHTTQEITSTIDGAHREIQLIQEYRTRLIADVVTGKLDVRGLDVSDAADLEELLETEIPGGEEHYSMQEAM